MLIFTRLEIELVFSKKKAMLKLKRNYHWLSHLNVKKKRKMSKN